MPLFKLYTVWRNKTDELVCLDATADEARQAMGLRTLDSFYCTCTRALNGKNRKWSVDISDWTNTREAFEE